LLSCLFSDPRTDFVFAWLLVLRSVFRPNPLLDPAYVLHELRVKTEIDCNALKCVEIPPDILFRNVTLRLKMMPEIRCGLKFF